MAIGRWISTAVTSSNSLPEQPSCPSRLRGAKVFFEGAQYCPIYIRVFGWNPYSNREELFRDAGCVLRSVFEKHNAG
jgi:hypothetical protein